MANWANPTLTSTYTNFVTEVKDRDVDLALGLDPAVTTVTTPPTNAIRWSSANNRWEKWNGSAWNALSSGYAISITGNAATATTLQTARTINGVSFNGSADINVNTVNALTFNNGGSGATSGSTFNGGSAVTISYNTVGAPSTTGTNASGTWGISISGNAATATSATSATTATNLAGGSAGTLPYQTGAGATAQLAAGTSGYVLRSNGTSAPSWVELDLSYLPGAAIKKSVRVATTANITLSGTQTIDGIAVVAGDRVLVKDQTTASQNGIYVVAAGAWARATDADSSAEIGAAIVAVDSGTVNGGELWKTTFKTTDTLGTTSMSWFEMLHNSGTWAISTTGSAATLTTGRTIGMTGDVTWTSASFNGSANVTGTATLANSGVTAGTYGSSSAVPVFTVDAKGRVTSASTVAVQGGQFLGTAATKAIAYNAQTIAENITVPANTNALSAGPITINSGFTVTITSGSFWVIV